jgi:hypothetical protein
MTGALALCLKSGGKVLVFSDNLVK